MLAAIARRGRLVVEELPEPEPQAGDALVEVKCCGICGSDLHTLHHADSMRAVAELSGTDGPLDPDADFVMGHEYSAEVLELGPETAGSPVAVGDLVVSMPFALGATADSSRSGSRTVTTAATRSACGSPPRSVPQGPERARRPPRRARRSRWPSALHAVNKSRDPAR